MDGLITEGATRLAPPPTNKDVVVGGPGARTKDQPFFNPGMALNRDLSVLLVEAFAKRRGREVDVADALGGTGARAIRWATEVEAPVIVHANDAMPVAVAAMRRNAALNSLRHELRIHEGDAHAFLASRRYDVVDLDPCGSPMPFLDAAVRATRHDGLVCVTATDTGALAGTFPRVCRRRYDAHHGLHKFAWRAEVGLRILAGAVIRSAARFERIATPVLSVQHGHWMRVVCRLEDGKKGSDRGLKQLGWAVPTETGSASFAPWHQVPSGDYAGPLWTGPLHEAALVDAMTAEFGRHKLAASIGVANLLSLAAQEAKAPAFWVVPDLLQKKLGPPPRRDVLVTALRAAGFDACGSHLDPQGVRTNASLAELRGVWHKPDA